jgi:hypothetical protein
MSRTARGWVAGIISGILIWIGVAFLGQFAFLALGLPSSDSGTSGGQIARILEYVIALSAFAIGALGGLRIGQRVAGPEDVVEEEG